MDQSGASTESTHLAQAFNRFGFRLYQELSKDGNCFFSPLGIAIALSALLIGAEGDSRSELAHVLGLDTVDESFPTQLGALLATLLDRRGVDWEWRDEVENMQPVESDLFTLRVASGLFVHAPHAVRARYSDVLGSELQTDVFTVDFERPEETAIRINQWVSGRTEERINQIVFREHVTSVARLVLANAVYFLARWEHQFDKAYTRQEPFHPSPDLEGAAVDVPMMHQTLQLSYMADRRRGFEAVSLPYRSMSMIVVLPDPGRFHDVDAIWSANVAQEIVDGLRSKEVTLGLPRFEINANYELQDAVASLGLRAVLDADRADLTGISGEPGLFLSKLVQAARIRVDEYGTEAAGAAIARMSFGMAVPGGEPHSFVADRPFFFCIRDDQTTAVLFMGRVIDPLL